MPNSLRDARIHATLDRLFADAQVNDAPIMKEVHAAFVAAGRFDSKVADLLSSAYIGVAREMGGLLYSLARAQQSRVIVEFGTSFGLSTIHLAAAVRDNGGGKIITSEAEPMKVERARANLREAGLDDLVEVRAGDARETLRHLPPVVDLLFLDGWKDLYLPVFELVRSHLRPGALVVADDVNLMPEAMAPYLDRIRSDPGIVSTQLKEDDGLEISLIC